MHAVMMVSSLYTQVVLHVFVHVNLDTYTTYTHTLVSLISNMCTPLYCFVHVAFYEVFAKVILHYSYTNFAFCSLYEKKKVPY